MIPYEKIEVGMEVQARGLARFDAAESWLPAVVIKLYPKVKRYPVMVQIFLGDGDILTGGRNLDELRLKPEGST